MPKELNLVPNQRLDIEDARYGMITHPVDMHKASNHRLWGGDYSGGYILSGFRVEIADEGNREIIVHNGVALDREGRVITFEEGDNFANNADLRKSIFLGAGGAHFEYIMVEFDLADASIDSRAVWDPTFDNGTITDTAGNTHPAPRGKEFAINIPTRRANSWRIVRNTVSFADVTDPGTSARTLRIPLAVIAISGGDKITIPVADTEGPIATVIRQPLTSDTILICDDTRHFGDISTVDIVAFDDSFTTHVTGKAYSVNDRTNNTLAGMVNTGVEFANIRTGDKVIATGANIPVFIKAGNVGDCRPMFFSTTDPIAAGGELANEINYRNNKYYAARALLNHSDREPLDYVATLYPDTTNVFDRTVKWPTGGKRTEHKLKTLQDYVMAMTAVVREMKYGEHTDRFVDGGTGELATGGTTTTLIDTGEFFDTSMVGGILTIAAPAAAAGTYTIASVQGLHQLTFTPAAPAPVVVTDQYDIEVRRTTTNTKWVDVQATGNLNEVFRARIDRVANTWTNDLQERLRANKVPIVTVGDGTNTFGDYIGDTGLEQALVDVNNNANGGIIYVKRGAYTIDTPVILDGNTVLMGDGRESTAVTLTGQATRFVLSGNNIEIRDISITSALSTAANTTGRVTAIESLSGGVVNNFRLVNCYIRGGSEFNAGATDEQVYQYALNLQASEVVTTDANSELFIDNCVFHIQGGGIRLQRWMGVTISNSTFRSEDAVIGFTGLVEGITFEGPSNTSLNYGPGLNLQVYGEVSISNCKFLGQHTAPVNEAARGWIFVAPNYMGQGFTVSGCEFIGDRFGAGGVLVNGGKLNAATQSGVGITDASYGTDTTITGCLFHSYAEGIRATQGNTHITGCKFHYCTTGVLIGSLSAAVAGGLDYSTILAAWAYAALGAAQVSVNSCNLFGDALGGKNGIEIHRNSGGLENGGTLFIQDSQFELLDTAIVSNDLATNFNSSMWAQISVTGCSFNRMEDAVWSSSATVGHSNGIAIASVARDWSVDYIEYRNNSHRELQNADSGTTYLQLSAQTVDCDGNRFYDITTDTTDKVLVHIVGGADQLSMCENKFRDCISTNAADMLAMEVDVSSTTPHYNICGNMVESGGANPGVQNGILFSTFTGLPSPDAFPKLVFNNNHFRLANGNYCLLASQDIAAGTDQSWSWQSVTAVGNYMETNLTNTAIHVQYSNDAVYPGPHPGAVNFLGSSNANPAPGYTGVLDFRRFRSTNTFTEGFATITNNQCVITGPGFTTRNDKDTNANIGIRISQWPHSINVSNNNLQECSLIIKWTYATPRTVPTYINGGYKINVIGNIVDNAVDGCAVDICPATGFSQAGDSDDLIEQQYTYLNFVDNIISSTDGSMSAPETYATFFGVTRFWALNDETTSNGETDRVNTAGLKYCWNIRNNTLVNSVFYMDSTGVTPNEVSALTTGAAPPVNGSLIVVENNTKACTSTAVQGLDILAQDANVGEHRVDATAASNSSLIIQNNSVMLGTTEVSNIYKGSRQ